MGNLCAIFHTRFKHLINIIPSARKAQLLDYILLGWQTSTYTLKNSNKKWFMKPYAEIVSDTGIPKSTLERYIKELTEAGYIVRRQALYSRTSESSFQVKKGAYIHISDKLLALLKNEQPTIKTQSETLLPTRISSEKPENSKEESAQVASIPSSVCTDSSHFEGIDPLKMRGLYIRDLYTLPLSNTISFKDRFHAVDKSTALRLTQQFESIRKFLLEEIQEEFPLEAKKLVLGTFFNLSFVDQKSLSSPRQLAAEYLYALGNVEFYMPAVKTFAHRNNILAKIIRKESWKTPRGFYKYFYLGSEFKDSASRQKQLFEEKMARELLGIDCPKERFAIQTRLEASFDDERACLEEKTDLKHNFSYCPEIKALRKILETLRQDIFHEGEYLTRLESMKNPEDFAIMPMQEATKLRLEKLYEEQRIIENKLEALEMKDYPLCA